VDGPMVVDLSDPTLWQDPYPIWSEARKSGRTALTQTGEPIVLDAADFDLAYSDAVFGQLGLLSLERLGISDGPFYAWRGRTMAAHDGAVHDRLRGTLGKSFTPRRVEPMRASLRAYATTLIEKALASGRLDVVSDYADELPLWLTCQFLGLPQGSRDEIAGFLAGTEEGFTDPMTEEGRHRAEAGITALSRYVVDLVEKRMGEPREDLVSDLVAAEAEGILSIEELVALVVNVIGGSVGSSRAAIANSLLLLMQHPEQADWVRASPDRIRPAVEECLRFRPPFRKGRRRILSAADRFDLHFEAGDTVFLARQAANRDPARWTDPDYFDVSRAEKRHYAFGYGPHFCLGNALARLDIQEAVSVFLQLCPGARPVNDDPPRIPFTADEQIECLPVVLVT
jgi:cytochrome P450